MSLGGLLFSEGKYRSSGSGGEGKGRGAGRSGGWGQDILYEKRMNKLIKNSLQPYLVEGKETELSTSA